MAKESAVIVLDVGKSMYAERDNGPAPITNALTAVSKLVEQKIMYKPKDELGLVIFGTEETDNPLADDTDDYQHVCITRDIEVPDLDMLRTIDSLPAGTQDADVIDALIVSLDLLRAKTGTKKGRKRIVLVTNATGPTSNPDDVSVVASQMKALGVIFHVVGIEFADPDAEDGDGDQTMTDRSAEKVANEKILSDLADEVGGAVIPCASAIEMMSELFSKSVQQRTLFKGQLEITPWLNVAIQGFTKTRKQAFPTLKKLSAIADQQDETGGEVKRVTKYIRIKDEAPVAEDQKVKGYKYGSDTGRVPISASDESYQYSSERCLKVLGFTDASNIPRHHHMTNVLAFEAQPDMANDANALSALIHALAETDKVALVRHVARKNAAPALGFMWPHIKSTKEFLYFNKLPFSEDIRDYPFKSLVSESTPAPTKKQLDAAEALIKSLDLAPPQDENAESDDEDNEPALVPKKTFNPALQHFYWCLRTRALDPNAALPPLDENIRQYVSQDADMFLAAKNEFVNFAKEFPLTKRDKRGAGPSDGRRWNGNPDAEVAEPAAKKVMKEGDLALNNLMKTKVTSVGSANPIADFKSMMECRDEDLVDKAMSQLSTVITTLVEESIRDQRYPKALECVTTMREYAIKESEVKVFNAFLTSLGVKFRTGARAAFWKRVVDAKVTLISTEEVDDDAEGAVSPDEAAAFLAGTSEEASAPAASASIEADDLLDEME